MACHVAAWLLLSDNSYSQVRLNLISSDFNLLILFLSFESIKNMSSLSSMQKSFRYLKTAIISPHIHLFCRLNVSRSFNHSSKDLVSKPQSISVIVFWTCFYWSSSYFGLLCPELNIIVHMGSDQDKYVCDLQDLLLLKLPKVDFAILATASLCSVLERSKRMSICSFFGTEEPSNSKATYLHLSSKPNNASQF